MLRFDLAVLSCLSAAGPVPRQQAPPMQLLGIFRLRRQPETPPPNGGPISLAGSDHINQSIIDF